MTTSFQTTRFLTLSADERLEAEYFVRRSDRRIFTGAMLTGLFWSAVAGIVLVAMMAPEIAKDARNAARRKLERQRDQLRLEFYERQQNVQTEEEYEALQREYNRKQEAVDREYARIGEQPASIPPEVAAVAAIPPVLVFVYFLLRHRPHAMGYLVLTNRRVLYYEYDQHPRDNYRYIAEARLPDVAGLHLTTGRSFLRKYMSIVVTTKRYAPICVSAVGGVGAATDLLRADASPANCVPADDAVQCIQELGGRIRAMQAGLTATAPTATAPKAPPPAKMPPKPAPPAVTTSTVVCETCSTEILVSGVRPASFTCPHCGSTT